MRIRNVFTNVLVVAVLAASTTLAQNAPPPNAPPGQERGRRFDPEQMRQRMMDYIRGQLGVGDKEWGAIQPALEEVMNLAREAGPAGMFGGRRGFFRPEGGPPRGPQGQAQQGAAPQAQGQQPPPPLGEQPQVPQSEVAKAAQALRATLDDKNATDEEIKAKMAALRAAREKAKKDLATSREALREMLTPRQEAVLLLMGILE